LRASIRFPLGRQLQHGSPGSDSQLSDFIEDADAVVPVDAASFFLLREQLESVLHTLSAREKKVIQLRFGVVDGRPRTLEEVGLAFAVTRERIRQIESKALSKLRHPSRSQRLKDYRVTRHSDVDHDALFLPAARVPISDRFGGLDQERRAADQLQHPDQRIPAETRDPEQERTGDDDAGGEISAEQDARGRPQERPRLGGGEFDPFSHAGHLSPIPALSVEYPTVPLHRPG
jgi:hypothetical protein